MHGAAMQDVRVKTSSTHDPMKLVDVIVDFQAEIRQEIAQAISLKMNLKGSEGSGKSFRYG